METRWKIETEETQMRRTFLLIHHLNDDIEDDGRDDGFMTERCLPFVITRAGHVSILN